MTTGNQSKMTFTTVAMAICIVLYLIIAIGNYMDGDKYHAGMWFCYGLANFFLVLYELEKLAKLP